MPARGRSRIAALLSLFPHLYALRIPILLALLLAGLPALVFWTDAEPMLAGLYDIAPSGMLVLTLLNLMAAWTLLLTSWMILAYAPARLRCAALFEAPAQPPSAWFIWSAALALPNIVTAIVYSRSASNARLTSLLMWSALGVLASFAQLSIVRWTARRMRGRRRRISTAMAQWLSDNPSLGAGYVTRGPATGPVFRRGHGTAALMAAVAFVLWMVTGWFAVNVDLGYPKWVFTLSYVVMLILLLCAVLPGVTFLFDKYRIPVLAPIVALPLVVGQCARSDHFYQLHQVEPIAPPSPGEALAGIGRSNAIVIAINGGGIQAAAWAAQALTGLEERARTEGLTSFADSVRLISSVSGGSVGAAYFLNEYDAAAGFDASNLEAIRENSRSSSLHAVGWGLLYWDIRRPYIPWSVGLFNDRGFALERAWRRADGLDAPLSTWRSGVREGRRPAVLFNATAADIGNRFLFSNTKVEEKEGQSDFHQSYPGKDVLISTAVRLSATFPYVSPVSRAFDGRLRPDEPHMADGGYYDAYGVSSLVHWLDAALNEESASKSVTSILVIEIRGDQRPEPKDDDDADPTRRRDKDRKTGTNHRSWSYQLHAPIGAMLEVRTAGQIAHNEAELCLLIKRWQLDPRRIRIDRVLLEFPEPNPPLSWHLTRRERDRIRDQWNSLMSAPCPWGTVRTFLGGSATVSGEAARCG